MEICSLLGVPRLVSRRILETLTYLARNHPYVAKALLHQELPRLPARNSKISDQTSGKAVMIIEEGKSSDKDSAVVLLLGLLNLPLYLRSTAHLEQVSIMHFLVYTPYLAVCL